METETSMRRCIYTTLSSFSKGKNYQPQTIYEIYVLTISEWYTLECTPECAYSSGEIMKNKNFTSLRSLPDSLTMVIFVIIVFIR